VLEQALPLLLRQLVVLVVVEMEEKQRHQPKLLLLEVSTPEVVAVVLVRAEPMEKPAAAA
jgi:hypothetical protein